MTTREPDEPSVLWTVFGFLYHVARGYTGREATQKEVATLLPSLAQRMEWTVAHILSGPYWFFFYGPGFIAVLIVQDGWAFAAALATALTIAWIIRFVLRVYLILTMQLILPHET